MRHLVNEYYIKKCKKKINSLSKQRCKTPMNKKMQKNTKIRLPPPSPPKKKQQNADTE